MCIRDSSHLRGNFHGSFHWKLPWTYRCKFPWKLPWKLVLWKLPWKFWTGPISAEVLEASMKASSMEDSVDFSVESSVEATPKGIHGSFRGRNSYGHPRKLPEAPVETFMEASSTVSVEAASVEASVLPRKLPSLPRKLPWLPCKLPWKLPRFRGNFQLPSLWKLPRRKFPVEASVEVSMENLRREQCWLRPPPSARTEFAPP